MQIRRLENWPRYVRGRPRENWRGPRRALTLDEQIEVRRIMREAAATRSRARTARDLAPRYGVSIRTIWRCAEAMPTPPGLEHLRMRIEDWRRERDLDLTPDDMLTLLQLIARHRDAHPSAVTSP